MASPAASSSSSPSPAPSGNSTAAPSVLDSVFNWIVDDKGTQAPQGEGEQPPPAEIDPWKTIVVGFEHVKAEVTSSIESLTAQKAPEQGQAPEGAAAGAEGSDAPPQAQSAFDLDQITKQASTVSTELTSSISLWYYGKEGEGDAPPQPGFKNTVDSLYTSFVGPTNPEEKKEEPEDPQNQQPFLADYFLPKPAEGEENAPPPEKVDVDKMVFDFFSGTASQLQRLIDQGPPIPDRAKAPDLHKDDGSQKSSAAPAAGGPAGGRAVPPPRPSSDSKSLIGASSVRVTPTPPGASPSPAAGASPSGVSRPPPPRPSPGSKP